MFYNLQHMCVRVLLITYKQCRTLMKGAGNSFTSFSTNRRADFPDIIKVYILVAMKISTQTLSVSLAFFAALPEVHVKLFLLNISQKDGCTAGTVRCRAVQWSFLYIEINLKSKKALYTRLHYSLPPTFLANITMLVSFTGIQPEFTMNKQGTTPTN